MGDLRIPRWTKMVLLLLGVGGVLVLALSSWSGSTSSSVHAKGGGQISFHGVPFVEEEPVAAFATSQVCSLVSLNQIAVGIWGQDGSQSIKVGSRSYFSFGDTTGQNDNVILPNSLAYVDNDTNGSDCVYLTSKSSGGAATALLPTALNELTVWPDDWVEPSTGSSFIYFFYNSVRSCSPPECDPAFPWKVQGTGLAKMTISNLSSSRVPQGCNTVDACLFWEENDACSFEISGASTMREGDTVYVFLGVPGGTGLGRVQYSFIENRNAYEYWTGGAWVSDPCQITPLWNQGEFGYNGIKVSYNQALGKYLAVYTTGFLISELSGRVADQLTGPWSDEFRLVDCSQFLENVPHVRDLLFICYTGQQHSQFERAGGNIIYTSYANWESYRVYLQEVLLGVPVYQWEDTAGNTAYRRLGVAGPAGFIQKGVAFYAYYDSSACTDSSVTTVYQRYNIQRIYEWYRSPSEYLYTASSSSPGTGFVNLGVAFCASTSAPAGLEFQSAAIRRWDPPGQATHVYSALDLGDALGYGSGATAFYARITNYRVTAPDPLFTSSGNGFQVLVRQNGQIVPWLTLSGASFSGVQPGHTYAIIACLVYAACGPLAEDLIPDAQQRIVGSGNKPGVGSMTLVVSRDEGALTNEFSAIRGLRFDGLTALADYEINICSSNCADDPHKIIYEVSADAQGVLRWGDYVYTVHHSVPPVAKETYSSAATAKGIISYLNSSVAEPSIGALSQGSIYGYAITQNLPQNPSGELDPRGVDAALGNFDPYDIVISNAYDSYDTLPDGNPYQGYNFTVNAHTDINTYMRDVAHWMDYPVPTSYGGATLANPERVPPAVPLFGSYGHWVTVNGFAASDDPLPDPSNPFFTPNFTVFGFWLTDPDVGGIGSNRFITASEAAATYFRPIVSGDVYNGKFVQVAEPPPVESDADVEIAPEGPTEAAGISEESTSSSVIAATTSGVIAASSSALQSGPSITEVDWDSVIPDHVLSDPSFASAYEESYPEASVLVHRLDGEDYYIVTFEKSGLTAVAVIVKDVDGAFVEATWAEAPEEYGWLTEQEVVELLQNNGLASPSGSVLAELIWEPGEISSSPFRPFWRVTVQGTTLYIRNDGSIVSELPTARILSPAPLSEYFEGDAISLEGFGHDSQDGFIGTSLEWTSRSVDVLDIAIGDANHEGHVSTNLAYQPQPIVELLTGSYSPCAGLECFALSTVSGLALNGLEPGREYKISICVSVGCQEQELASFTGNADASGQISATFPQYAPQFLVEIWVVKTSDCSGLACFASSSIATVDLAGMEPGEPYSTAICPQVGCTSGSEVELGTGENIAVSDLPAGTHIISLTATDSDENSDRHEIHIVVKGWPDLEATAVYGDSRAWSSGPQSAIIHRVVVKNQGIGASEPTTLAVYRSVDDTLDAGDVQVGVALAVPPLQPGQQTTLTYTSAMGWGVPDGRRRTFISQVDPNDAINESDEANNTALRRVGASLLPYDVDGDGTVRVSDIVSAVQVSGADSLSDNWNPDADLAAPFGIVNQADVDSVVSHYFEDAWHAELHLNSATPSGGGGPLTVTFNSSAHYYEGDIVEFKLDYNGDNVWDSVVPNSDVSDVVSVSQIHTYSSVGTFAPRIGVTDTGGYTDVVVGPQITVLDRPSGFAVAPLSSTQLSFSWQSVANAASYELCSNWAQPNPGVGGWSCENVGNSTSVTRTVPTTTTKATYYYAVRALTAAGTPGNLSRRGAVLLINETVSGIPYHSYFTIYKSAVGMKLVNGFNQHTSATRWLAFSNTTAAQDIKAMVSGNSKWYASASAWDVPELLTYYGPLVQGIESPYSTFTSKDYQWTSTWCMGSEVEAYCE